VADAGQHLEVVDLEGQAGRAAVPESASGELGGQYRR